MKSNEIFMKHMGASAADLQIHYRVDEDKKIVEMEANHFDSALVGSFILRVLKEKGIVAVYDDRELWCPPHPPYQVFLSMEGVRFEIETHLLPEVGGTGNVTIVLRKTQPDACF